MFLMLSRRNALMPALVLFAVLLSSSPTLCQQQSLSAAAPTPSASSDSSAPSTSSASSMMSQVKGDSETNLEIQLQLLVGSNAATEGARLPGALDATVRQLRSTIQLTNYRLGATFLHRVTSGRALEVKGTGGALPLLMPSPNANSNPYTPMFYNFSLRPVELRSDLAGREVISIREFNFGIRVPVGTSLVNSSLGSSTNPQTIQYENIGIFTGVNVPEGQPVVVGTMYMGQGDVIAVVLTAKKLAP